MAAGAAATSTRRKGVAGVVLLVATVLFAGLYRVADGAEKHSYNAGAVPPLTVEVTRGRTYEISVPGGRKALDKRGITTAFGQCSWTRGGAASAQMLKVTMLSTDARPTHALATFVAPASGRIHLDCGPWGAVFVDDSDDSGWDFAGLFLVLTAICATLAVALGLSALYSVSSRHAHEIEGGIGIAGRDGEVPGNS